MLTPKNRSKPSTEEHRWIQPGRQSFSWGEGVQFATNVLKSNETVAKFCWCHNSFHSTEEACNLTDTILEHQTISSVTFCELSSLREADGIDLYAPVNRFFDSTPGARTVTLLRIDLRDNGIKTDGDRCIPDFLSTNPQLKELIFSENQLNNGPSTTLKY